MRRELFPFKKGQTIEVNTTYTMFTKGLKVVVLVPNSLQGRHELHDAYGSEVIMVALPHMYNKYNHISPNKLLDLWRTTNRTDVPIYVYEDYRFKAIAETNAEHARLSLEVLD